VIQEGKGVALCVVNKWAMFKATHVSLLDLLIADKKDIASDNENSILLLMKHIWLCEMFLERKGQSADPSFDTLPFL